MRMLDGARREVRAGRVRLRKWPILVTVMVLATGMAYSLAWGPVVRHRAVWVFPEDIWGAYRSAHFIGWGSLGSVYAAGTRVVTFPGIMFLLAPLAMVTGGLGMTESFPRDIPHPTAWLALGPFEILIGCSALFAFDALATRLGVSPRRRAMLCLAEGVVLWPTLVLWGHPEDALALALGVFALVLALERRWTGAGWIFGAAVATQPLVILMLPVLLAMAGRQRALALLLRSVLPGAVLLATPLISQFHATTQVLLNQPNFPNIDHTTPWTPFAPRLGGTGKDLAVAAGPGRVVALLGACLLGWWARRWRHRPDLLVWAAAIALALRCLTESVMDPYYVWPTLALGLVLAGRTARWRQALILGSALAVTVCAESYVGEWLWWSIVTGGLLFVLLVAFPGRASRVRPEVPIDLRTARTEPVHTHARALVEATQ
jgi:hypothetical protein